MGASSWIAAILATVFAVTLGLRLPRLLKGSGNLWLWLTHLAMTVALCLVVEPIYLFVDRLMGSMNLANLFSHFCINLVFFAGGTQVALSAGRKDVVARIRVLSATLLPVCLALMTVLFFVADLSYSDMGLNAFRSQDNVVVLYKLVLYIYPAIISSLLVRPLLQAAADSVHLLPYYSRRLMAVGTALVVVSPMGHLAELANRQLNWVTDILVYPAILLVLVGATLGYISTWRLRQKISRAD